jgi:hypothetical protein
MINVNALLLSFVAYLFVFPFFLVTDSDNKLKRDSVDSKESEGRVLGRQLTT